VLTWKSEYVVEWVFLVLLLALLLVLLLALLLVLLLALLLVLLLVLLLALLLVLLLALLLVLRIYPSPCTSMRCEVNLTSTKNVPEDARLIDPMDGGNGETDWGIGARFWRDWGRE